MNILIVVGYAEQNDQSRRSGTPEARADRACCGGAVAAGIRRGSGFSSPGHPWGGLSPYPGGAEPACTPLHPGTEAGRSSMPGPPAQTAKYSDVSLFGSAELGRLLAEENEKELIEKVTLIGLCTDICVISNALLVKAFLPEAEVAVDAACCAGVTPESHRTALAAMKSCQITVEREALPL